MKTLVGLLHQDGTLQTLLGYGSPGPETVALWLYENYGDEAAVQKLLAEGQKKGLETPLHFPVLRSKSRDLQSFLDKVVRGPEDTEEFHYLFVFTKRDWWAYEGKSSLVGLPLQHLKHEATPVKGDGMATPLFLGLYGDVLSEKDICGGRFSGQPCEYSENGKFPGVAPLNAADATYNRDKGNPGDLCPRCAKQNLSHLGHWHPTQGSIYPTELLPLRLFKCRMWHWLVVEGLREANPTRIELPVLE